MPGFDPANAFTALTTSLTWKVNPQTRMVVLTGTDANGVVWTIELPANFVRNNV